jgi:hypothetical protein
MESVLRDNQHRTYLARCYDGIRKSVAEYPKNLPAG